MMNRPLSSGGVSNSLLNVGRHVQSSGRGSSPFHHNQQHINNNNNNQLYQQQQQQQQQPQQQNLPLSLPSSLAFSLNSLQDISMSQLSQLSIEELTALQQHLTQMNQQFAQSNQLMQQQLQNQPPPSPHPQQHPPQQPTPPHLSSPGQEAFYAQSRNKLHAQQQQQQQQQLQHHQQHQQQHQQHMQQQSQNMSFNSIPHSHHSNSPSPTPSNSSLPYSSSSPLLAHPFNQQALAAASIPYATASNVYPAVATAAPVFEVGKRRGRTAARISPSAAAAPLPQLHIKLKRKLRKNNREKQRRTELNDKFEYLCELLHLNNSSSKVEKFTILAEAATSIEYYRAVIEVYENVRKQSRDELKQLESYLADVVPAGTDISALVTRLFPSLSLEFPTLPEKGPLQYSKVAMGPDDSDDEQGDEQDDMQIVKSEDVKPVASTNSPSINAAKSTTSPAAVRPVAAALAPSLSSIFQASSNNNDANNGGITTITVDDSNGVRSHSRPSSRTSSLRAPLGFVSSLDRAHSNTLPQATPVVGAVQSSMSPSLQPHKSATPEPSSKLQFLSSKSARASMPYVSAPPPSTRHARSRSMQSISQLKSLAQDFTQLMNKSKEGETTPPKQDVKVEKSQSDTKRKRESLVSLNSNRERYAAAQANPTSLSSLLPSASSSSSSSPSPPFVSSSFNPGRLSGSNRNSGSNFPWSLNTRGSGSMNDAGSFFGLTNMTGSGSGMDFAMSPAHSNSMYSSFFPSSSSAYPFSSGAARLSGSGSAGRAFPYNTSNNELFQDYNVPSHHNNNNQTSLFDDQMDDQMDRY